MLLHVLERDRSKTSAWLKDFYNLFERLSRRLLPTHSYIQFRLSFFIFPSRARFRDLQKSHLKSSCPRRSIGVKWKATTICFRLLHDTFNLGRALFVLDNLLVCSITMAKYRVCTDSITSWRMETLSAGAGGPLACMTRGCASIYDGSKPNSFRPRHFDTYCPCCFWYK